MNEKYKSETIKKWGNTETYKEFTTKTKDYSTDKLNYIGDKLNSIFKSFSVYLVEQKDPNSEDVQNLVNILKNYISDNLYLCNNEMLLNLGTLYVTDERFKMNIDKYCIGNADYINDSIKFFCQNN